MWESILFNASFGGSTTVGLCPSLFHSSNVSLITGHGTNRLQQKGIHAHSCHRCGNSGTRRSLNWSIGRSWYRCKIRMRMPSVSSVNVSSVHSRKSMMVHGSMVTRKRIGYHWWHVILRRWRNGMGWRIRWPSCPRCPCSCCCRSCG